MSLGERLDAFPSHKWMARLVLPVFAVQRLTQAVDNATFDTVMIVYLWWLSEVTAQESWLARREVEDHAQEGSTPVTLPGAKSTD